MGARMRGVQDQMSRPCLGRRALLGAQCSSSSIIAHRAASQFWMGTNKFALDAFRSGLWGHWNELASEDEARHAAPIGMALALEAGSLPATSRSWRASVAALRMDCYAGVRLTWRRRSSPNSESRIAEEQSAPPSH